MRMFMLAFVFSFSTLFIWGCGDSDSKLELCYKYCDRNMECDTTGMITEETVDTCKQICEATEEDGSVEVIDDDLISCVHSDSCPDFNTCLEEREAE